MRSPLLGILLFAASSAHCGLLPEWCPRLLAPHDRIFKTAPKEKLRLIWVQTADGGKVEIWAPGPDTIFPQATLEPVPQLFTQVWTTWAGDYVVTETLSRSAKPLRQIWKKSTGQVIGSWVPRNEGLLLELHKHRPWALFKSKRGGFEVVNLLTDEVLVTEPQDVDPAEVLSVSFSPGNDNIVDFEVKGSRSLRMVGIPEPKVPAQN